MTSYTCEDAINMAKRLQSMLSNVDTCSRDTAGKISEIANGVRKIERGFRLKFIHDNKDDIDRKHKASIEAAKRENASKGLRGSVRVGHILPLEEDDNKIRSRRYPLTIGYRNIVVTSSKIAPMHNLHPTILRDENGHILENVWQFSHVYPRIAEQSQERSGWKYSAQNHIREGQIHPSYQQWRSAGIAFKLPVRHPAPGSTLAYIISPLDGSTIKPDDARSAYCEFYMKYARETDEFKQLHDMLDQGYNIQLLDVNGPQKICDSDGRYSFPYDIMASGVYGEDGVGSLPMNEAVYAVFRDAGKLRLSHIYPLAWHLSALM